jgi:hypothetical protein
MSHKGVKNIMETKQDWIGEVKPIDYGMYVDLMLVLIFGGIPWQVYFQRVLSAKTEQSAMYLSYIAAIGCFVAGIPPIIIGAIAKSTSKSSPPQFLVLFHAIGFLEIIIIKRLDHDRLQWHSAHTTRAAEAHLAARLAVSYATLRRVLRPGRSLGGRHVIGRLECSER